jgi:outer membrane phospholipase A
MRCLQLLLSAALLACAAQSRADEAGPFRNYEDWFQPYEPSTIGVTNDSDDVSFLDVTLSLQLALGEWRGLDNGRTQQLAFAFTGRFGFYMSDARDSRPVIGKRLNPKLMWRIQLSDDAARFGNCQRSDAHVFRGRRSAPCAQLWPDSYLEFAYAHESNGQSIDTEAEYVAARNAAEQKDGNADFANDRLSRGWDYLGVNYQAPTCGACESERYKASVLARLRYFLPHGLLEGAKEEWHPWEAGAAEGKARNQVNGLAVQGRYLRHTCVADGFACDNRYVRDLKFVVGYETGYHQPFHYGTLRVEAGVQLKPLPITLWWQRGYGADLAQYYKKTTSFGIAVDIGSF